MGLTAAPYSGQGLAYGNNPHFLPTFPRNLSICEQGPGLSGTLGTQGPTRAPKFTKRARDPTRKARAVGTPP